MAQERPITPEKQLLRLIEEQKGKSASTVEAQAIRYQSLSLFSFGAWLGRLSFLKNKFKNLRSPEGFYSDSIRLINRVLISVIVLLVIYLISDFYFSIINLKRLQAVKFNLPKVSNQTAAFKVKTILRDNSYYLDTVKQRDIFRMGLKSMPEVALKAPSSAILEMTQNLKLVGISWSDDPDAMIEDTKLNKTFFVKKGYMVGELKVKAILKDKVILSYGQEEIDLR
ncbi:MAG: hypothetical protein NC908_04250 [Candidatus Omnitrophica bacterium]|nr:hypothetical protein [Candidatus Omnitrophota bacterium]